MGQYWTSSHGSLAAPDGLTGRSLSQTGRISMWSLASHLSLILTQHFYYSVIFLCSFSTIFTEPLSQTCCRSHFDARNHFRYFQRFFLLLSVIYFYNSEGECSKNEWCCTWLLTDSDTFLKFCGFFNFSRTYLTLKMSSLLRRRAVIFITFFNIIHWAVQ